MDEPDVSGAESDATVAVGFARLDETITDYIQDCRDAGLSPNTVRRYEITLRKAQREITAAERGYGKDPILRNLPADVWRRWLVDHYGENKCAPKTWNAELSKIRAFLNWCYENNRLSRHDRHMGRLRERVNQVVITKQWITEAQLPVLMDAARQWHERDAAFVAACFYTMRRAGEVKTLRVKDFDFRKYPDSPHGRMHYTNHKGKGRRNAFNLPPRFRTLLTDWFEEYRRIVGRELDGDWYAFPALVPDRDGFCVQGMRRLMTLAPEKPVGDPSGVVAKAMHKSGLHVPGNAAHALRRGGAREVYYRLRDAGHPNPLRIVKFLLDHRSEQQTEEYLGIEQDRIEAGAALAQVFPDTDDIPGTPDAAGGNEADDLMADLAGIMEKRPRVGRRVA